MKLLGVFAAIVLTAGFASPALADTKTAGYYDQFGNFHVYQTYVPPVNNSYYGGGQVYGPGYNQTGYNNYNYNANSGSVGRTCPADQVYNAANNICGPAYRTTYSSSVEGLNLSSKKTASTNKSATISGNAIGQASAVSTLLGTSKKTTSQLAISNIVITSGPKNIYDDKSDVNCDVLVSWTTTIPAAGQVVYGPTSQPDINTFNYPSTAPEGNSYKTAHEVKMGCLENVTYMIRIIQNSAGPNGQRVVSDEQTIFPIKIRTQIPVVVSTDVGSQSSGGASVMSTLGAILTSPILFIILIPAVLFFVIRMLLAKKASGGHAAPAHIAEPALQIPHH